MGKIYLSVVIPCYNEEANIKRGVLEEVYGYLSKKDYPWQVIVSDDGSTDGSVSLIEEKIKKYKPFKLLKNPHGGKPSALMYGIGAAEGKFVLFTDMDQSTPISEIPKLLSFADDFDVVIGSRGITREDFPLYRKLGALVFSYVRRSLILPEIKDTQCGFKLFETDLVKKYFPKLDYFRSLGEVKGWKVSSWDVELLHMVKRNNHRIKEVDVVWKDRDVSVSKGGSLKKYFKESKEMLGQIVRVKINDLKGIYNE